MLKLLVGLSVVGVVFGSYRLPQLDGRIVGGDDTDITKHPYQLALLSNTEYFCGGVIVSYTWGLTAAHCFDYGIPFNLRVRGGSTNRSEGGQLLYVDEVLRHPNYHSDTLDYDAALMRFSEPFAIFATAPATMPELNHQLLEGEIGVVTGWGALQNGGVTVEVLQEVEVPLVSLSRCRAIYGASNVTDRMFCAGYVGVGGKDACEGDSGGPLIINGILIGLVSWGTGCADPNYPGVYTRVPAFSNWVLEIIERSTSH